MHCEGGWAHNDRTPLAVSHFTDTCARNVRGPDELRQAAAMLPDAFVTPFHYARPSIGKHAHSVTGKR